MRHSRILACFTFLLTFAAALLGCQTQPKATTGFVSAGSKTPMLLELAR